MSTMNVKNFSPIMRKHVPEILTVIGIVGTVVQAQLAVRQRENSADYQKLMFEITGHKIYLYRYLQMTKSNNWLRMHGIPMRKRKRH